MLSVQTERHEQSPVVGLYLLFAGISADGIRECYGLAFEGGKIVRKQLPGGTDSRSALFIKVECGEPVLSADARKALVCELEGEGRRPRDGFLNSSESCSAAPQAVYGSTGIGRIYAVTINEEIKIIDATDLSYLQMNVIMQGNGLRAKVSVGGIPIKSHPGDNGRMILSTVVHNDAVIVVEEVARRR